ncbi:hypothetical protein B0H19DRAFT_1258749 [Mycena capillaripes]|nr:hypothetical protein B0H19DRAFT_1258749 [Mycena capillaripes]
MAASTQSLALYAAYTTRRSPRRPRIEHLECERVVVLQRQLGVGAQRAQRVEHWAAAEADFPGYVLAVARGLVFLTTLGVGFRAVCFAFTSFEYDNRIYAHRTLAHTHYVSYKYRAPSTLRHRKGGMFMLLDDGITGGPAFDVLEAAELNEASDEAALADDELTECYYDCEDQNSELDTPVLPPRLEAIAFPASAFASASPNPVSHNALSRTVSLSPLRSAVPFSAHLHVAIFVGVAYLYLSHLAAACVSQFVGAWSGFSVKDGEDSWEAGFG